MEPCDDPYCPGRPARRTQWLVSALAHHYGLDRGAENEVIVLATGLDQYLQEIFHHLDWQGLGTIPGHDFLTLCQVLGLEPGQEEECEGLLDNLPPEMPFRLFHSRLCGYFSTRAAGCQAGTGRLPLGTETEHIETQIRLRSPLRRRDQASRRGHQEPDRGQEEDPRILGMEQEISSLRELVEDMRAALQSSDARCLALQVGLCKSQASGPVDGGCVLLEKQVPREVTPIQSSRDSQMEEVMLMNKDLGEELDRTQKALECLEEMNLQLKREQSDMRRKAEDARQALLKCLGKVRDLEEKSRKVPLLQMHIKHLEMAMQDSRSEIRRLQLALQERAERKKKRSSKPYSVLHQGRRSPTGDTDNVFIVEDQMFRSVEGQAASDEEEEKWTEEQRCQEVEGQHILTNGPCCDSGCDERVMKQLLSDAGRSSGIDYRNITMFLVERISRLSEELKLKDQEIIKMERVLQEVKEPLVEEMEKKSLENEMLGMELQMLETERVRLSLVEEKLLDVLQLLQQVRDQKISKRELGRIILSTLESSSEPLHGKEHVFEVLDGLHHKLSICEVVQSRPFNKSEKHQLLGSNLVISC